MSLIRTRIPPQRALIDACVLAVFGVADLLLRLYEDYGLLFALWSEQVLEGTYRAHLKFGWGERFAANFRKALQTNLPASMVRGHEHWIPQCTNHEGDRHVLAAAIEGRAEVIITANLTHFPEAALAAWKIRAVHPSDYLLGIYTREPKRVRQCLKEAAQKRGMSASEWLRTEAFAKHAKKFSETLLTEARQD